MGSREDQHAFVLRVKPSGIDRVDEALADGDLRIGWSEAAGLLDETLTRTDFREILYEAYHAGEDNYRRAGANAGTMWRFIREMSPGDLVVVPHSSHFHVARVTGPARYEESAVAEDTAYRRKVEWLADGDPIPRRIARAPLQSRMKTRQTCAEASDLLGDIRDALQVVRAGEEPTFAGDLRQRLVEEALGELREGRLDSFGFENLIATLLTSLGADTASLVARREDEGADILATFQIAETFQITLAVQAKHYYRPKPPVPAGPVEQLVRGMEVEDATHGWVVTAGTFSEEAEQRRGELEEETGYRIELIDGEQLAAMLVDGGLRETVLPV